LARRSRSAASSDARIIVMGPLANREVGTAREARLEVVVAHGELPTGIPVHLKLDTGIGRFGLAELPLPPIEVVGLMSHLATADSDVEFVERQLARFLEATKVYPHLPRHIANSAAALRIPATHLEAVRCGIALYGLSPFGQDPALDGLEPALRWESQLAQVKLLQPGESTGYGRRFVAEEPTWIGLVPVGYADGFRRDLTGTTVLVAGERRRAIGTVSMDSFAVELDRELPSGTPVTIVGDGLLLESTPTTPGRSPTSSPAGSAPRPPRRVRAASSPIARGGTSRSSRPARSKAPAVFAYEQRPERVAQVLRAHGARLAGVVHRPVVAQQPLLVEDEHLRRPLRLQRAGQLLRLVVDVREREALFLRPLLHALERVLGIRVHVVRVDGDDPDAATGVVGRDPGEAILPGQHVRQWLQNWTRTSTFASA